MNRKSLNALPHAVYGARRLLALRWHTALACASARWWGIHLGPHCQFGGRPRFYRHCDSEIIVGASCRFNSAPIFNLAGLNRRCTISTLRPGARIEIGAQCGFSGTVIAAASNVALGCRVRCGANATIMDTDWHPDDPRAGKDASVTIEDDVWLGMNVTVLKGVTIGRGTLVGSNSLVTKSLPEYVVATGSPARVMRNLTADEIRRLAAFGASTKETGLRGTWGGPEPGPVATT